MSLTISPALTAPYVAGSDIDAPRDDRDGFGRSAWLLPARTDQPRVRVWTKGLAKGDERLKPAP